MSNLLFGQIITTPQHRDAVHVAVAPVIASETLHPGQHIGLVKDSTTHATALTTHIGIVDPYLRHQVSKGQQFWLFLYPQTVTGLRHDWSHPAFPDAVISPVAPLVSASEKWLRDFGAQYDLTYAQLLEAAKDYIDNGRSYCGGEEMEGAYVPNEFWSHYEAVTGVTVDAPKRESFFRCAC